MRPGAILTFRDSRCYSKSHNQEVVLFCESERKRRRKWKTLNRAGVHGFQADATSSTQGTLLFDM